MGTGGNKRKAGARREKQIFIGAWVPKSIASAVDKAIRMANLDRAKFLRIALEEKIRKETE